MDRFNIAYDEHGIQKHNEYIERIAQGIIRYWERKKKPLEYPEYTYGLIHRDRKILEMWEQILKKEGLL